MRYLYSLPVPATYTDSQESRLQQQLEALGLLGEAGASVTHPSGSAPNVELVGRFRYGEPYDAKIAKELESLSQSTYGVVPLYDDARDLSAAAYYDVNDATVEAATADTDAFWSYDITLTKAGTSERHWRRVRTTPVDVSGDSPWSAGGDPTLAIDASATKTQWYTKAGGTEVATPTDTVAVEGGDVARFDPTNSSLTDPSLIASIPFDQEVPADVVVWDTAGRPRWGYDSASTSFVGDGSAVGDGSIVGDSRRAPLWAHVFTTDWERATDGIFVLDNGRLRVYCDDRRHVIMAERWDGAAWQAVSIDHGDYALFDADLVDIDAARSEVHLAFRDQTDDALHHLRLALHRGADDALLTQPPNTDSTPSDLQTMLDPIAADWSTDLQPSQDILAKQEVRG